MTIRSRTSSTPTLCLVLALLVLALGAGAASAQGSSPAPAPTFSKDVAPILQGHCQGCHRPGQIGPMPLLTYADARPWAKAIERQVSERKMPPYFAHPDSLPMRGDLNLSQAEIDTLIGWARQGALEGDPRDLPPARQFEAFAGGWALKEPELVLQPAAPYLVGKEVDDEYRCYFVELGVEHDLWLKAVEFKPGNSAVVHHFILFGDAQGIARSLDDATPEPGWECGQMDSTLARTTVLQMWAPGNVAPLAPAGIGKRIPGKSQLILQAHYHNTTGEDQLDGSRVALHLAHPEETIEKEMRMQLVSAWQLEIPAGQPRVEHQATWTADSNITLYSAGGHMHYRGKDIGMWATRPGRDKETILWIPHWDFNWQHTYVFAEPYPAPAGTEFVMISHHDNSAENPHNPALPPVAVHFGLATSDEMAFTGFGYTLDDERLGITPQLPAEVAASEATGGR